MGNLLLINAVGEQKRIALIEHGVVSEVFFERGEDRGIVGNIYLGKVIRVLPGMQSAFVDIGLARTAFLYVMDVVAPLNQQHAYVDQEDDDDEDIGYSSGQSEVESQRIDEAARHHHPRIEEILKEGQRILVQVSKEPIGAKGARITTNISLPGRSLVYLPTVDHVGVSRRIEIEPERERLKEIAQTLKPAKGGLIIRTAGEGRAIEEFKDDLTFLLDMWTHIEEVQKSASPPSLIHEDLDLSLRSVRDLLNYEFEKVYVDDAEELGRVLEFVERFMPRFTGIIDRYDEGEPMFDKYGVELEVARALERKVWLKSGGYIVIDETEALTAIDVNTGRYVGKGNVEETVLKINLEAVKEIAFQLRLRNIGGIIIIDFIDMMLESSRDKVYQSVMEALKRDKAKCNVLPISTLGLLEMTRKRVKGSLHHALTMPCFYCDGKGYLKTEEVIVGEIVTRIKQEMLDPTVRTVHVFANPRIIEHLYDDRREELENLERLHQKTVLVKSKDVFHLEQHEVFGKEEGKRQ